MGLSNLIVPTQTFEIAGEKIVVRGLGLDSIIHLICIQGAPLQAAYQKAEAGQLDVTAVAEIAATLMSESPVLVAHIIACGAGEPEEWAKVMAIPFAEQLELLEAIGRLTFALEGGPKKVFETVVRVMGSLNNLSDSLKT